MGISLLEELDTEVPGLLHNAQIDTAFFITYTLNLSFFEQLILPRLRRLGAVHIGILVDRRGYQATFDDPLGHEECGRSYVVETIRSPTSLLHAKLLWLHGSLDIVYVGSHNLTASGYNDQLEVTARLTSSDRSHLAALRSAHQAVAGLVSDAIHLGKLWRRVAVPEGEESEPSVHFLSSQQRNLLDQLIEVVGASDELSVVTPFLDTWALVQLRERLGARKVELLVPHEGTDTPLVDTQAAIPGIVMKRVSLDKRLHAKAYSLISSEERWLALGSANCTQAGLTLDALNGGNIEFLVLLRGGQLADGALQFETIHDPAGMPGTGRRWDEQKIDPSNLHIRSATYRDGILIVDWWSESSKIDSVRLIVGNQSDEFSSTPIRLELDRPSASSVIELEADLDGKRSTARGWLIFPDELEAQVASRDAHRWREYLASADPIRHADGVDAYLSHLIRDLLSSEDLRVVHARSPSPHSVKEVEQAIEVFTFSMNPFEIGASISRLVSGNPATDPLAALRGLVTRLCAAHPPSAEPDDVELARHGERRERAMRSVADRLIQHLSRLTAPELDWSSTQKERIVYCLRGSFEAIALLWHKVVRAEISPATRARFAETLGNMISALSSHEPQRVACSETEVAGPLVLVLGVAAEAAHDPEEYERVRKLASQLFSDGPEGAVEEWKQEYPERVSLLVTDTGGRNLLESWLRPALLLFGIADSRVQWRQERWDLLLRLYEADRANDPAAEQLCAQAERLYGSQEAWLRYKAGRASHRLPVIRRVLAPVCGACFQRLPDIGKRNLERGEAVVCRCGAILLFGKSSPP